MKIIKKQHESYYYGIDKYCCKDMEKYLGNDNIIWISNGKMHIGYSSVDSAKIIYCPFCGEKIE
jgi:hypothetical protein